MVHADVTASLPPARDEAPGLRSEGRAAPINLEYMRITNKAAMFFICMVHRPSLIP